MQPTDESDVRTALLWGQEQGMEVAVKCGGHSSAGTSSTDGGLVLDLSRMRGVRVNEDDKTLVVQGGTMWAEVDEVGAAHGLAAVGGTVNHTGVGGLTLGGGYGYLTGLYGLTIDNLISARVVLADGQIVKASAAENEDLFWGLRGAGYNFGVVVEFTYQGHELKDPCVFAGTMAFTNDKLEQVVKLLNAEFGENPDPAATALCGLIHLPAEGNSDSTPKFTPMVVVVCVYIGSREQGESYFSSLVALGTVHKNLDMVPYPVINGLLNPSTTYGDRKSYKGLFFRSPLDPQLVRDTMDELTARIHAVPDLAASSIILEYVDMRKVCEVPVEATALASRNATQNGVMVMRWKDPKSDLDNRAWAKGVQDKWKATLDKTEEDKSGGDVPQYINYAERMCFSKAFCSAVALLTFVLDSRRLRGSQHLRPESSSSAEDQGQI